MEKKDNQVFSNQLLHLLFRVQKFQLFGNDELHFFVNLGRQNNGILHIRMFNHFYATYHRVYADTNGNQTITNEKTNAIVQT